MIRLTSKSLPKADIWNCAGRLPTFSSQLRQRVVTSFLFSSPGLATNVAWTSLTRCCQHFYCWPPSHLLQISVLVLHILPNTMCAHIPMFWRVVRPPSTFFKMSTSHHSGLITTSVANFCHLAFGNANYGVCLFIGQTDRQTDIQTVFKLLYVQPPELKNGLLYYFSPITRELGRNLRDFTNSVLSWPGSSLDTGNV